MFSHQSAEYSIVVAHMTSIALKDIPVVCMPIIYHLCASDIRLRTMLSENDFFFKTPDLNTQIRSMNILNFE